MKKLVLAASLLAFSVSAFAAMPPKPKKCPSDTAISSAGLSRDLVMQDQDGTWLVAVISNNYDTKKSWTFVVGKIDATDEDDAFDKATSSLDTLSFMQGPMPVDQINKWACIYNTEPGYVAAAITPAFDGSFAIPAVAHTVL